MHQLTRVPEAAVSLVVDAISVEPSLVWTIAVLGRCGVVIRNAARLVAIEVAGRSE